MRTTLLLAAALASALLFTSFASPVEDPLRQKWNAIPDYLHFSGGLAVDADGSPGAYHPDPGRGLDLLRHAGTPGNWYGILTHNRLSSGIPVRQQEDDPKPGFFISVTALFDTNRAHRDPNRYADATKIPYIALSPKFNQKMRIGDYAIVFNTLTEQYAGAVFADIAPHSSRGEGSIALAEKLGVRSCPRTGGKRSGFVYILFPGSGRGQGYLPSAKEIRTKTAILLKRWGGPGRLRTIAGGM